MKVIKEGEWKVPWSAEFTCKTCKAVLLVGETDVVATNYKDSGYHCICCICRKTVNVPSSSVPLRVREEKDKKRERYSSDGWYD